MKVRRGFVSNSSSSSFVCDICCNVESGFDASPTDLEMARCENGHIVCQCHLDSPSSVENLNRMTEEECPICNFSELDYTDVTEYVHILLGKSRDEVEKEMQEKFKNFSELKTFIRGNRK